MPKTDGHIAYLFYRIGTPTIVYEQPKLYAVTFDKKLAKKFQKTRNMNFFKYKESYIESPNRFQDIFRSNVIRLCGFETKSSNPLQKRSVIVTLPCTFQEEETVFLQTDHVFYEIGKTIDPMYRRLLMNCNADFKEVLNILKLQPIVGFHNCITSDSEGVYPEMSIEEKLFSGFDGFGVLEDHDMKVDQLGLFIHFFGDTLDTENIRSF